MDYKEQFKEIVKQNIHREGINQLIERLENQISLQHQPVQVTTKHTKVVW